MISDIIIHKKGRGEGAISAPLNQEPQGEPAQDPPGAFVLLSRCSQHARPLC